jgi:hypothetical protein
VFSPGEEARFEAYLVKRASGAAGSLGCSYAAAWSLFGGDVQVTSTEGAKALLAASGNQGIIADCGASVRVIGEPHLPEIVNVTPLEQPVIVETADGNVSVNTKGDLPGRGGLMKGCLIIPTSRASLLPIGTVCEELDAGFNISQGNKEAVLYRDSLVIQKFDKVGSLHVLPLDNNNLNSDEADLVESAWAAGNPLGAECRAGSYTLGFSA